MTQEERLWAFTMRCRGWSWERIGAALHYDGRTVAQDLWRIMRKPPYVPPIRYPVIADYVQSHMGGSINRFAGFLGVSPQRLRAVLIRGETPSKHMAEKICDALQATPQYVFREDNHE